MNYLTQSRTFGWLVTVLLFGFLLPGCNTLPTGLNVEAVNDELDKLACKAAPIGPAEKNCYQAYAGNRDERYTNSPNDPESLHRRELRLLRAYIVVEASTRYVGRTKCLTIV